MSIVLAATWQPRGELPRLRRLLPRLEQVYTGFVVVLAPDSDREVFGALQSLDFRQSSGSKIALVSPAWSAGRFMALQRALDTPCEQIHYADLDRLLRWAETRPEEWRRAAGQIGTAGCLIFGRTEAAYRTHPQALIATEAISNAVVSDLLGMPVDASAGSKGFSRPAVEYLIAHTRPRRALGTDAEWPILLNRAGFQVDYLEVDGLDWESPDQHQPAAAGRERQAALAEAYDRDPANWSHRAAVALEIVQSAQEAARRPLPG
jgi:hypothetical protein